MTSDEWLFQLFRIQGLYTKFVLKKHLLSPNMKLKISNCPINSYHPEFINLTDCTRSIQWAIGERLRS